MSMLVEVDRATLKHCHSRWDHLGIIFCRKVITTSGIRPPSWNFWVKEMSAMSTYTPVKTLSHNIGIATEIASISVSVAKLLLFPVRGIVSISGLYLMVCCIVWRCRRKCMGIGRARKLCRSRWDHVEMSSHRLVITTFGIGGFLLPVCISDIKNLTCTAVFVCFNHFHREWVYLSKCGTITSISW